MTVKELMDKLAQCGPNLPVVVENGDFAPALGAVGAAVTQVNDVDGGKFIHHYDEPGTKVVVILFTDTDKPSRDIKDWQVL